MVLHMFFIGELCRKIVNQINLLAIFNHGSLAMHPLKI